MTLEFTDLLRPLAVIPLVAVLLLATAIVVTRIRGRRSHPHGV